MKGHSRRKPRPHSGPVLFVSENAAAYPIRRVATSGPPGLPQPGDAMRTDQDQPVRLSDYQPPDWLVETVALDVSLHPTATRVRATLEVRPNPSARAAAPLMLDGDGLTLKSIKLDDRPLTADSFT